MRHVPSRGTVRQQGDDGWLRVQAHVRQRDDLFGFARSRRPDEHEFRLDAGLSHAPDIGQPRVAEGTDAALKHSHRDARRSTDGLGHRRDAHALVGIALPEDATVLLYSRQVDLYSRR